MPHYIATDGVNIHYRTVGNPNGTPIVFLHGGPALGCSPTDEEFFDVDRHFVIFIDQRGSPNSPLDPTIPLLDRLDQMRPQLIMEDLHAIIELLQLDEVYLFGGSWGATLALLYTIGYPDKVKGMILRGSYLATTYSHQYIVNYGKGYAAYPRLIEHLSPNISYDNLADHYFEKVVFGSDAIKKHYSLKWINFAAEVLRMPIESSITAHKLFRIQIQLYYIKNRAFLPDQYIRNSINKIDHVPTTFVHGIHDHLCPLDEVKLLIAEWPSALLVEVDAGHFAFEPLINETLKKLASRIR